MISNYEYKGLDAFKIENDILSIVVIPELGGKIASLIQKDKNFEFYFQNKKDTFFKPQIYDDFSKFDASGFDDCFPSVDASSMILNGRSVHYPDHGEIWSKSMSYEITCEKLKLQCSSEILPYNYEKIISIKNNNIHIDYKIINSGSESFPCIWTMHGLLNCENGMEIHLPPGVKEIINVQNSRLLGNPGLVYSYPDAVLEDGTACRLNRISSKDADKTEKFYINEMLSVGECGLYYPSKDLSYKIYFDKEQLPYLGIWISEGGFRGDYNLALEPSNGFYDKIEIARNNSKLKILNPGEKLEFELVIEISDGIYL